MFSLIAAVALVITLLSRVEADRCAAYEKVDCFIASGGPGYGYGSINPGAQLPYSPLRLGQGFFCLLE